MSGIKNLSVNNIHFKRYLPKRDNGRRQLVEGAKAARQLFVTHQKLAKPIEPAMSDFHDPAPSSFTRTLLELLRFLMPSPDMRNVAMPQHRRHGSLSSVASIGT